MILTYGYRVSDVKLSLNDADPSCRVNSPVCEDWRDRRVMFRRLRYGYTGNYAPIHVDSNDVLTQTQGLQHRVARITPASTGINHELLHEFRDYVRNWVREHLNPLSGVPNFEEWLASTSYNMARKDELRRVHDSLHGSHPSKKQNSKVASFIKTESYPEFKHARWINSRSDHFKVYSGPYFKAIEKAVFDLPWFIKHVPVPERCSNIIAMMRDGARYVATDYTSFEAHFHPLFMAACEGELYSYMLQNCGDAAKIIPSVIMGVNHGRTRRGVSFVLKGRRMSGDMCTSLGNGFSNLMIWSFLCHKMGTVWDGRVEGDDGIFAVYSGKVPTPAQYAELGFTIKMEIGSDPRVMGFCGIVAADGQNIRDPRDFLANFGWTSSFLHGSEKLMDRLLRSKALSAAWETPHCPIIRAIADRALFLTRGIQPRHVDDGFHTLPPDESYIPAFCPTMATRMIFADLYGVDIKLQVELEESIRKGEPLCKLEVALPPTRDYLKFAALHVMSKCT